MDVLRAALGDSQLNYLGKSYGTFLGSTYAGLFPKRVGRFVLDGVVPPDLTNAELSEGQARGFELATRTYVADCVAQGDCPIGSSVEEGCSGSATSSGRSTATRSRPATRLPPAWRGVGVVGPRPGDVRPELLGRA